MGNQKEYLDTVKSLAEMIKTEWINDNNVDVCDRIFEVVDGNHYVIYYAANLEVLQYSDNDDCFEDQGIELDTSKGWRGILAQVAYFAMHQDVSEALKQLGWDGTDFDNDFRR